MTDEIELAQEEGLASVGTDSIPGYIVLADENMKAEARRAFVMSFVADDNGMLLANWAEEAAKIEAYLKAGEAASKRSPMKVVK